MPQQRLLSFTSLDEVMPEVDRLLAGHTTIGTWSLGQILDHLATALRLTCVGAREIPSLPRSDVFKRRFFRAGRFPRGADVPHPSLIPSVGSDPREQAAILRQALARFASASGPFPEHPYLGVLDKAEWARFHSIHCAHHLGFALPVAG
jgi:hypothetical protein